MLGLQRHRVNNKQIRTHIERAGSQKCTVQKLVKAETLSAVHRTDSIA